MVATCVIAVPAGPHNVSGCTDICTFVLGLRPLITSVLSLLVTTLVYAAPLKVCAISKSVCGGSDAVHDMVILISAGMTVTFVSEPVHDEK